MAQISFHWHSIMGNGLTTRALNYQFRGPGWLGLGGSTVTHPFIISRMVKWLSVTHGDLVIKINVSPHSGSSALKLVKVIQERGHRIFKIHPSHVATRAKVYVHNKFIISRLSNECLMHVSLSLSYLNCPPFGESWQIALWKKKRTIMAEVNPA